MISTLLRAPNGDWSSMRLCQIMAVVGVVGDALMPAVVPEYTRLDATTQMTMVGAAFGGKAMQHKSESAPQAKPDAPVS